MAKPNDPMPAASATERVTAPVTSPRWIMPHEMQVERVGNLSSGVTNIFPTVRGGVCDHCGVLDGNVPSEFQYKLCQHYRGMQLSCSYCPSSKNIDDVNGHAVLRILQHPDYPNKLLICCDSYECKQKHEQKWKVAVS